MTLTQLENALDEVLARIEELRRVGAGSQPARAREDGPAESRPLHAACRQLPAPPPERHRVARELLRTLEDFLAMVDELERELIADALDVYHHARRLAKEQGPDSPMAEVAREMERAWRASHPRARRKRKGRRSAASRA
jgi:hypothetical protein